MAVDVPETWRGGPNSAKRHSFNHQNMNDAVEMHDLSPTTTTFTSPTRTSNFKRTPLRDSKKLMALIELPASVDQKRRSNTQQQTAFINNAFERDRDYHSNQTTKESLAGGAGAYDVLQQIITHFQNSLRIFSSAADDHSSNVAPPPPRQNLTTSFDDINALQHLAQDPVTSAALKIYQLMVSFPTSSTNSNNLPNTNGDIYAQVRQQILHVRAHFHYEPDEDAYIPCKELGQSFSCGDILHVLDHSDPCWWQAYRDDFEQSTTDNNQQQRVIGQLAGLIPSFQFQQQREQLRRKLIPHNEASGGQRPGYATIAAGQRSFDTVSSSTTSGFSSKNLKRIVPGAKSGSGGNGNGKKRDRNSSALLNDSEIEEFQPYEEVALLYPRTDVKRPIVLIGPPSVGRKELRESLMKSDANNMFQPAVPHTTRQPRAGELNGVVYHFIARKEFEDGIMRNRFIEHGEFEKQLYGTSFDAVSNILSRGKYCVLNLLPQLITALRRASDLRPFVVFIAPPPIDKLRFNLMSHGVQMKDDELLAIIEEQREMEAIYGHLFHRVIVHTNFEQAYLELRDEVNKLENEPHWVPACWLR